MTKPAAKEPDALIAHYWADGEQWFYRLDALYTDVEGDQVLAHADPHFGSQMIGARGVSATVIAGDTSNPMASRAICAAHALGLGFEVRWESSVGVCRRLNGDELRGRGVPTPAVRSVRSPTAVELRGLMMVAASDPAMFKGKGPATWITHAAHWIAEQFDLPVHGEDLGTTEDEFRCVVCGAPFLAGDLAVYRVDEKTGVMTAPIHQRCPRSRAAVAKGAPTA